MRRTSPPHSAHAQDTLSPLRQPDYLRRLFNRASRSVKDDAPPEGAAGGAEGGVGSVEPPLGPEGGGRGPEPPAPAPTPTAAGVAEAGALAAVPIAPVGAEASWYTTTMITPCEINEEWQFIKIVGATHR
jgi:hypothetical protein